MTDAHIAAHAPLSEEKEGLIALGMEGDQFIQYAARLLLDGTDRSGVSCDCRFWMIVSALRRKDRDAVRVFVNDWSGASKRPVKTVWKWAPGDHYYVYDAKHDSLAEAMNEIKRRGHVYGGLQERFVYPSEGA